MEQLTDGAIKGPPYSNIVDIVRYPGLPEAQLQSSYDNGVMQQGLVGLCINIMLDEFIIWKPFL